MTDQLTTILIDDERHSLDSLDIMIKKHCPALNVLELCRGAKAGIEAIRTHKPDFVFLDIDMPIMNGFELLNEVRDIPFDVIFATAYDEYAVRAVKVSAMDYLLKPIDKTELKSAVQKVIDKRNKEDSQAKLDVLLTNIQNSKDGFCKLAIPTSTGLDFVDINNIIYCIADGSYTSIHMEDGHKYIISKTLKEMTGLLDNSMFFRSHQSYLVNLNYIKTYVKGSGGQLIMEDGAAMQVARARKEELMQVIFKR
jgi:two-component system LytT family response regulator